MTNKGNQESEKPCPDCGEMVRPNSVRCWNCGGFMRKDMAVKYQQMQLNPKPLTYLEMSESDMAQFLKVSTTPLPFQTTPPITP